MSSARLLSGFLAKLKTPYNNEESEEVNERFWDKDIPLFINYEGTIIYSKNVSTDNIYHLTIEGGGEGSKKEFKKLLKREGIEKKGKVKRYVNIYYDGVDSDIDELTLEKFKS